jgi:gliding motility-associated-like protein
MKKLLFIIVLFCGLGINQEAKASHAAGGELTYEWLTGSTYRFTFKFYRDCTGGPLALDSFGMCYYNTCNNTYYKKFLPRTAFLPGGITNGTPVPTGCPNPTQCTSSTSIIPGFEEWWYQGDVTLSTQCTEWSFWISENARNPQDNLVGNDNLHIQTSLNNLVAQGNSSPNFTFKPVPYICLNQPWIYNNGAFDINGDSLSYASILPFTTQSTGGAGTSDCIGSYPPGNVTGTSTFPYNPATNPIPNTGGYSVNAASGLLYTVPSVAGQYVITIEVSEWRNGVLIGKILRDIQIAVVPCVIPIPSSSPPTTVGLTYDLTNNWYKTCINDTITFCTVLYGPVDTAQITCQYNMPIILPGSITTVSGYGTDSVIICTQWVPTSLDTGYHNISILFKDTSCNYNPIAVISAFSFAIYVTPATDAFGDTTICAGATAQLGVVGGSSFTWSVVPGGAPPSSLSCTNCANPIVNPLVTTYYKVISNLTTQCADNVDTVKVIVAPVPIVNAGVDTTVCPNSIYQMVASVTPAAGNYTYQWTPATSLNLPATLNPIVINPVVTTDYILTVIPNGVSICAVKDTMRITVLKGFDIKNNDTTVCIGSPVFINTIGSSGYTYLWTPATNVSNPNISSPTITPDTLQTYTLTASFPGCPDSIQSITLDVEIVPNVNAGPDRLICIYDTVRLQGSVIPAVADPFYTYLWTASADLSSTSILDPSFTGLTSRIYTLTVKTPKGCQGSDNVAIQVIPTGFLTPLSEQTICPGDSISYTLQGGSTYLWQPGIDVSDSLGKTVISSPLATTIFTIYGKDVNGCNDTITVKVFVAPNAILSAGADLTLYPGDVEQIILGGNCNSWAWSPATGLSSTTIMDPVVQPTVTTQYAIAGSTEYGCTTSDTIVVNVLGNSLINLPNAFSPGNGSSANDQFRVNHNGIATLNYLRIFDRWGVMVFESNSLQNGWNGRYKDVPQPIGTYVYQVDALDNTGKRVTKTGNFTLIR